VYQRSHSPRAVVLVVLVLAAVVVITVDFRQSPGGPVERLQEVTGAVFGPVQRGLATVLRPVGNILGAVGELGSLRSENRRLHAEVQRLRGAERANQELAGQNQQLRSTLRMAARCGCKTVGATVVASSGSNFQWSVTIDAGSRQGVTRDMAVINADGLVGRVVAANPEYATVLLVVDPTSGVAAHVSGGGTAGLVRGRGSDGLSFEPLHAGAPVGLGDLILSQGYAGGVFPNGLPIGLVEEVGPPRAGLVRTVTVRPFADATGLDQVAVVISSPAPPPAPGGGVRTDLRRR
jgi:rod shape-determining protein MreC